MSDMERSGPTRETAMVNLAKGNRVRAKVAELKDSVREAPRDEALEKVADIIQDPPEEFGSIRVGKLLRCVPYVGSAKVRLAVRFAGIASEDKRLRQLSERQRLALAEEVRELAIQWHKRERIKRARRA